MNCVICKGEIEQKEHWAGGNNAEPMAKGRCCDACNMTVVIPLRHHFINNPL